MFLVHSYRESTMLTLLLQSILPNSMSKRNLHLASKRVNFSIVCSAQAHCKVYHVNVLDECVRRLQYKCFVVFVPVSDFATFVVYLDNPGVPVRETSRHGQALFLRLPSVAHFSMTI